MTPQVFIGRLRPNCPSPVRRDTRRGPEDRRTGGPEGLRARGQGRDVNLTGKVLCSHVMPLSADAVGITFHPWVAWLSGYSICQPHKPTMLGLNTVSGLTLTMPATKTKSFMPLWVQLDQGTTRHLGIANFSLITE